MQIGWLNPYFYNPGPKKNRSESERDVRNTWIPQCHIRMLDYAYSVYGISVLSRFHISSMHNVNPTKIGKHASVILYVQLCMQQNRQLNL